ASLSSPKPSMSSTERWRFRIEHIVDSIDAIRDYVAGLDERALAADRKTLDAVLRNFQVIGEAVRKVPKDVQVRYEDIPWREMERMRHKIVHDYDRVSVSTVWQTIHEDLVPLLPLLTKLLKNEPEDR
ncbi:MAG: DUF86 domain-containing protein, partial [Geminicoccaceae bacterium]